MLHASIRENERRARLAGDQQAAAYWAGREQAFQEILHRANRAALEYLQAWAGVTRTGYHGTRVDGREPGRFEPAGLIVTSWLQGTSRDGDPQDHIHNQIARITRTFSDGKWRALDTMSVRAVLGALQAIAATAVECELTREFGVQWIPRADGRGNEIRGITQAQMDAYSTRTVQVHEKERELARAWERKHGRAPTSRELLHIANDATLQSRKGKDAAPVDWDALARAVGRHARRRAGRYRADGVERARPGRTASTSITAAARRPDRPRARPRTRALAKALVLVSDKHPAWTRHDLLKQLAPGPAARDPADEPGGSSGAAARPGRGGAVRADRRGGVPGGAGMAAAPPRRCAANWTDAACTRGPASRGTPPPRSCPWKRSWSRTRRRKARRGCPASWPRGASAPTRRVLEAELRGRAHDARAASRAARAAAGPGRRRLARPHLAPHRRGDHRPGRHRQDPRPGHRRPGVGRPGVRHRHLPERHQRTPRSRRPGRREHHPAARRPAQRGRIPPGSLIVADEGSMISITHLAAITEYAARNSCKLVLAGDQEQLAAVEGGGAMTLLADRLGYVQLAEPVRFTAAWERGASLRLRQGDATALDEYDQHGRIRGAPPDQAMDQAVRRLRRQLPGRAERPADGRGLGPLPGTLPADPRRSHPPRRSRCQPGRCGSPRVLRPRPGT